jgi:O-antigen ligase
MTAFTAFYGRGAASSANRGGRGPAPIIGPHVASSTDARRPRGARPVSEQTAVIRGPAEIRFSTRNLIFLGLLIGLVLATIVAGRISDVAFFAVAGALLATFAYAAYRAPRLVIMLLAFTPLVDRYLIGVMVPDQLQSWASYLSESLLFLAGIVIAVLGLQRRTLTAAFRHPVFYGLVAFAAIGIVSAAVNAVPPITAAAGIIFTIDAAALYFLPRIVGFERREVLIVAVAFVAVATIAAVLALAQVLLRPDILGLASSQGRFGEGVRVGSFLNGNPNMLGAILGLAVPFPVFAIFRLTRAWRVLAICVAFVLILALFFTFSRGAWLGLGLAMVVVGAIVDRRAILALLVLGALAYGAAHVMPRHILGTAAERSQLELDIEDATIGRIGAIGAGNDLRTLFIQNAVPIIRDHPLVGAGPGRWGGAVSSHFTSPLWDQYTDGRAPEVCPAPGEAGACKGRTVDNFWLHILVEFGILGALVLVGVLAAAGTEILRAARRTNAYERVLLAGCAAAVIVLGVDSISEMLLEGNTSSFVMWLLLGLGSALAMTQRRMAGMPERASPPSA